MKRILVPTDFSDNAYAALLYVSRLYSEETLQISLLHAFEDEENPLRVKLDLSRSSTAIGSKEKQLINKGNELIAQIQHDVRTENHSYEMIVTSESLAKTVNSIIAENNVDLVVVGSKGRSGIEDVIVGSNTIGLTESIEGCPLFIVPNEIHFILPTKIAFSSDFNEFYPISKLKPVTRLVRHFRSEIAIVHVGAETELTEEQRENYDRFALDLTEYDAQFHFISKKGNISDSLRDFIDSENIDLFTLAYHKHAFLKKLFREPVVNRIGKHKRVPTLIIPVKQN